MKIYKLNGRRVTRYLTDDSNPADNFHVKTSVSQSFVGGDELALHVLGNKSSVLTYLTLNEVRSLAALLPENTLLETTNQKE